MDLHYRFNVVSRQLTGLDDPNTNLREKKNKKQSSGCRITREQIHRYTEVYKGAKCAVSMKVEEEDLLSKRLIALKKTPVEFFFIIKTTNLSTDFL